MKLIYVAMLFFSLAWAPAHAQTQNVDPAIRKLGEDVYSSRCATCHDHPTGRTPTRAFISITRSADFVLSAFEGVMQQQASGLTAQEREAVAVYLAGRLPGGRIDIHANKCIGTQPPLMMDATSWNGWDGGHGGNTRYRPTSLITEANVGTLKLSWTFAYPGGASGQPAVIGDRIFAPSMGGVVFSLDARTGCTYWATDVGAPLRSAVTIGKLPSGAYAVFFGDMHGEVHALDTETGKELWRTRIENHPMTRLTGSVTYYDGRIYAPASSFEEVAAGDRNYKCCTFRGSVSALDAATGTIIWKTYSIDSAPALSAGGNQFSPAGAAIWSATTIDPKRGVLYASTGNSYTEPAADATNAIIAMDLATGAKRWMKQITPNDAFVDGCEGVPAKIRPANCPKGKLGPDFDFGSSVILVTMPNGKERLLATSKSGLVYALDPDRKGAVIWTADAGGGGLMGGAEWGAASDDENIYVSITDLRGHPRKGRKAQPGLNSISTMTGKKTWGAPAPTPVCSWGGPCQAAFHSAPSVIPGVVFAGAFDGHERAYATKDGKLLWDFDTGKSFNAVNGVQAVDGSIDQGGQIIAGSRVFVNSGARNGYPGNALLVFEAG